MEEITQVCSICGYSQFVVCTHCKRSFCFDHYEQHVLERDRQQRNEIPVRASLSVEPNAFHITDKHGNKVELDPDEARFILTSLLNFIPRVTRMPDAYITSTASPAMNAPGPKSYFLTIEDEDEHVRLEIRYDKREKSVTADIAVEHEYDYTEYDNDELYEDDEDIPYDPNGEDGNDDEEDEE